MEEGKKGSKFDRQPPAENWRRLNGCKSTTQEEEMQC